VKRKLAEAIVIGLLIGILVLVGGIVVYLILSQRREKIKVDTYTDQVALSTQQFIQETQRFFDLIVYKPGTRGGVGEGIVELVLSNIPDEFVKTQYSPPDISGRIDFMVKLPNSEFWLPIDSKFILPEDLDSDFNSLDEKTIKDLRREVIKRAKGITQYIGSEETADFVLMYVPDFVYGLIDNETYDTIAQMSIVPTNTSGLLSTVFMINMQHRFVKLNKAASEFGRFQIKLDQGTKNALNMIRTSQKQLTDCLKNVSNASQLLEDLNNMIETLEIEGS